MRVVLKQGAINPAAFAFAGWIAQAEAAVSGFSRV
jgi:hypothetical protein